MINNFSKEERRNDVKLLLKVIAIFLFVLWLCTPPGNKFAQICFYGNHTQHFIATLTKPKNEINEYIFHRNNAIYLARMDRKKMSLAEMDLAIIKAPNYLSEADMIKLYTDRAEINLFFGEYKNALSDFVRIKNPNIVDKFKIALLYKKNGNNEQALNYCNSIFNTDSSAYSGYACYADLYASYGRFDVSVKVYDMLINKVQNRAQYYRDRAYYKKLNGDMLGYEDDIAKARDLAPFGRSTQSIVDKTLNPARLKLSIVSL